MGEVFVDAQSQPSELTPSWMRDDFDRVMKAPKDEVSRYGKITWEEVDGVKTSILTAVDTQSLHLVIVEACLASGFLGVLIANIALIYILVSLSNRLERFVFWCAFVLLERWNETDVWLQAHNVPHPWKTTYADLMEEWKDEIQKAEEVASNRSNSGNGSGKLEVRKEAKEHD